MDIIYACNQQENLEINRSEKMCNSRPLLVIGSIDIIQLNGHNYVDNNYMTLCSLNQKSLKGDLFPEPIIFHSYQGRGAKKKKDI